MDRINVAGKSFDIPSDCTAELSPRGYQFFTDIFESFDQVRRSVGGLSTRDSHPDRPFPEYRARAQDHDGALSVSELETLFSTSPGNPWLAGGFPETTITTPEGAVTLQGWLAQWS